MSILGIVAEYDPFHNGHARHMTLAQEAVAPTETLVVLSGCFRQRGDLALLSPYDRASCALAVGADAVFALPAVWTLRSAEQYAQGAIALLSLLGCTHIAFGAECDDLDLLSRAAEMLESPPDGFRAVLRRELERGMGFPRSQQRALESMLPEAKDLLSAPNNILALSYLRGIRRLGMELQPVLIPRTGSYHTDTIDPSAPSATALRSALCRGDWCHALSAVPESAERVIRKAFLDGRVSNEKKFDTLLLNRLRNLRGRMEMVDLPDDSEGLSRRVLQSAVHAQSRKELLERASTSRYSAARVSRMCACAMLDITGEGTRAVSLPDEALLLGLQRKREMTKRWKTDQIPILSSIQDSKNPPLWEADRRAWSLWALCSTLPDTLPFSEHMCS